MRGVATADLQLAVSKTVARHLADLHSSLSVHVRNDTKLALFNTTMGRGQVVRHQFLVLAFAGSNPAAPAIFR